MTSQVRVLAYRLIRVVKLTAFAIVKIGLINVKGIPGRKSTITRGVISKVEFDRMIDR